MRQVADYVHRMLYMAAAAAMLSLMFPAVSSARVSPTTAPHEIDRPAVARCCHPHTVSNPLQALSGQAGVVDIATSGGEGDRANATPARIFLDQNYPNPFNPSTMVRFGLPEGSNVRITIHSLLGTQLKVVYDGWEDAGVYTINIAANDLPSGVYFYRLETDFGTLTRRMTISK